MNAPPVIQPPKSNDKLLRNVLIAGGIVVVVVLVAACYVFLRFFGAVMQSVELEAGKKQVVQRDLGGGWKEVRLQDLDWTVELPAVARKRRSDLDAEDAQTIDLYHYYTFWDISGALNGTIESTTYKEQQVWSAEELMDYDRRDFVEDGVTSQWKASHETVKTGGRPVYFMTYRYIHEGDPTATRIVYWQHMRELHSIALSYYAEDEKEGKAAFERIWKSMKPPILPTRSPSG